MAFPVADSYSGTPGSVIRGGIFYAHPSAALMGDSLTADGYGLTPFYTMNGWHGGRIKLLANCGVSGQTISQMLSRVNNLYTNALPGLAGLAELVGAAKIGYVIIRAGANNYRDGGAYPYTTMNSLLSACATYATRVVMLSCTPVSNSAGNTVSIAANAYYSDYATANSSWLTFINDSAGLRNPDGSQIATYFVDDVHLNSIGRGICGNAAAPLLASWANYPSQLSTSPLDVYPAQQQWFRNPTNIYSGPAKTGAIAGQLADNMSFNAPGISGTCEIVSADVGDENQVPWQRLSLTQATAANTTLVGLSTSGRAITSTDPSIIDAMVEVRCIGLNTNIFTSAGLYLQGSTGEFFLTGSGIDFTRESSHSRKYVIRNRKKRAGSTLPAYLSFYLTISCSQIFGPQDTGSIDFRCVTARG